MITVDDKIEVFTKIVLDRLEESYSEKISELDEEAFEAVKVYEEKLKEKSRKYIEVNEENARGDARKKISKVLSGVRTQMLRLKHDIVLELCDALRERVNEFRSTPEYLDFLKERIKKSVDELNQFGKFKVELLEEDMTRYRDTLLKTLEEQGFDSGNVEWAPLRKGIAGGLIFYNEVRSLKLDGSFDVLLEDAEVVIGQLVSELLEERGEANVG
ncbi:V-type ATP synthase subunit E [Acidaminobacter hydrogenoformans]|uniref:H+-ATPase subunit E/Vma4 n=1 Tax=Acidaminobacter hydrogenoformans DSM 2784 TaxID=1120920 RepID=A0A1G5S2V6_9FIRM|nr:V-type ATP synthase subunit E family protein [Acidaminobacter hydrogenoformans]SCZ80643.1 H+-ATPase subunit E/Vma4 [Acidaminobacter hydrogenoformans DSM 2784]